MWGRDVSLVRLNEEPETLAAFDRIHELDPNPSCAHNDACVSRQKRRSEIAAEIARFKVKKSRFEGRTSIIALLLCVTLFAVYHYLLK